MVLAPGISIREILEAAPARALEDFIGPDTIGVIRIMNPELLTRENLVLLAIGSAEPWEMLRDAALSEKLVSMMPVQKAVELAGKLGLGSLHNRVFDGLVRFLRQHGPDDRVIEFFGVAQPERAAGGGESAESIVDPAYPLFAHQLSVADRARDALVGHPYKVLVHMPTGAGKTRTAMHLVCEWHNRASDRLIVWLAQSAELLEQAASEFERAWSSRGRSAAKVYRYWGDYEPDLASARTGLLVAGFGKLHALYRRDPNMILRLGDRANLTVVDEAHQAIAPTFSSLISFIVGKRPGNALLGLSATPGRTWSDIARDAELSAFFDNRKVTIEAEGYANAVDFLTDHGFLARPTFRVLEFAADAKDRVPAEHAEIGTEEELGESLARNDRRNVEIVRVIEELASRHRRIIVFAAGVPHAHLLSSVLTLRGTEAHVVTASTDRLARERVLRRFKGNGVEPQVVCNYGVLTTGFDAPMTSAAVIARPTRSLVLYSQMVGRAIRGPKAGGNAAAEIVTVVDTDLPGFGSVADAFVNWRMSGDMAEEANKRPSDSYIIPAELAIKAMRDSGYRNTAYAVAELIDNSVQAKASLVELVCDEEMVQVADRRRRRVRAIGVIDNGLGMAPELLRRALQFGYGTHLNDRSGIGRFGIGLPNASISQGRRVDIWSWQRGPANAVHCYLDVDEIEAGRMRVIPEVVVEAVPAEWNAMSVGLGTSGTLVIWSKFDEERLSWKGAKATLEHTAMLAGRIYRKFIADGSLRLRLAVADAGKVVREYDAQVNDPLYLSAPSATPAPFDRKPMFQRYGERDGEFKILFRDKTHVVHVRASWALPETWPDDGTDRGAKGYGKHAAKNIGVSIMRAGRELDLDSSWTLSYDPRERWWGMEIEFPPELDEIFGVTNNKQAATTFSHMVNFDWSTEAEPGENYTDFKRRLAEDGDHRAPLIEIVDYIRDTLRALRELYKDQGKNRRGPGKRHDDTSVDDRASTKFKERADSGHATPADGEVFDDDAEKKLVEDLVKGKQYEEEVAKEMAAAVLLRKRKVIFVEATSDMDAFFYVESKPGGVTEIVFNRSHPAFDLLIGALDAETAGTTERDLVARIQNASDTIKMLFAAWARQELEDVPGRERIRRMRQDWGRMARDFLTDERED